MCDQLVRMTRHVVLSVLVTAGVASAQPAPAPAPAPTPPAPPVDQAPPPAAPEPLVEPTPPVVPQPVIEEKAEPKKDEKPAVHIKYDGGLKFSTDDDMYEMKIQFRNQMRFQATRSFAEETPTRHNQWLDSFLIPRARLQAEGHLFGKANRYKLEFALGDQGNFAFVKDMFIEKRLPNSGTYVRFGQWKRPFNRPEIVSDFASTFNERSIQNEQAGGGRDLGIALHNEYDRSPEGVEWVIGMFNGFSGASDRPSWTTACVQNPTTLAITCVNSRPTTVPADFEPTIAARLGYNSPKSKGYSESDLEGGPLRYSIAGSYKVDLANFTGRADMRQGFEVDANIKAYGFSLLAAADAMFSDNLFDEPEYGFVVQPAMFVIPKHLEGALRFAYITGVAQPAAAGGIAETSQIEARAAINWYWHGHTLKLANDAGFLVFTSDDLVSHQPTFQLRMMLQLQI
jgi:hypothetical protein